MNDKSKRSFIKFQRNLGCSKKGNAQQNMIYCKQMSSVKTKRYKKEDYHGNDVIKE